MQYYIQKKVLLLSDKEVILCSFTFFYVFLIRYFSFLFTGLVNILVSKNMYTIANIYVFT